MQRQQIAIVCFVFKLRLRDHLSPLTEAATILLTEDLYKMTKFRLMYKILHLSQYRNSEERDSERLRIHKIILKGRKGILLLLTQRCCNWALSSS